MCLWNLIEVTQIKSPGCFDYPQEVSTISVLLTSKLNSPNSKTAIPYFLSWLKLNIAYLLEISLIAQDIYLYITRQLDFYVLPAQKWFPAHRVVRNRVATSPSVSIPIYSGKDFIV